MQKDKTLKKITSGILSLGVIATSFAGYTLTNSVRKNDNVVYAISNDVTSITNGDFYYANSSTPSKPTSGWSAITDKGSPESSVVTGIYNHKTYTTNSSYLEDYNLIPEIAPGNLNGSDEGSDTDAEFKSLMINSPKVHGNFGYKSTSSITLEAGSYYSFDITLKTFDNVNNTDYETNGYAQKFDSFASIYLNGLSSGSEIAKFEKVKSSNSTIQTANGWATYTIFVETSEFATESNLSLELWLGTQTEGCVGPAFFNSVKLKRLSRDTYYKEIEARPEANKRIVTLANNYEVVDAVVNPQFALSYSNGWTTISSSLDQNNGQVISTVDVRDVDNIKALTGEFDTEYQLSTSDMPNKTNFDNTDESNVLLIRNTQDNHVALLQSSDISIIKHGYYRISVWVWRNTSDGTINLNLIDKDGIVETSSITATATNGGSEYNGTWTEYNFYVTGSAHSNKTVALQLGLEGVGYVYFDDVKVYQVSYSDYQTGSGKSNTATLSFDVSATNYQVSNDDFDVTANDSTQVTYPLAPKDWTANVDENTCISGVVNTDETEFAYNLDNYSRNGMHPNNPGAIGTNSTNNNVLMIGNVEADASNYYTSSSITLSSSSYYHFTAYVKANSLELENTVGAYIKLYSENQTYFEYNNILSNQWKKVELYIATGEDSITANIDLGMTAQGYAFFDKIQVDTSSSDVFEAVKASGSAITIDLSNESFENYIQGNDAAKFEASNFTATNVSATTVDSGVADLEKNPFDGVSTHAQNGRNALYIQSIENSYYYFASNNAYSFSTDTYYKLSVYAKTYLNEEDEALITEDSEYGASITLNYGGTSYTFYGIDTQTEYGNDWKEYVFYITVGSTTSGTLELALGSDKGNTSGLVLFDNITLATIDEDEFNEAQAGDAVAVINTTSSSSSSSSSDTTTTNTFNWYIVPSLITALAIFVALIGTLLRKVNWKRRPKIATSYDRGVTLDKDLSLREQMTECKALIAKYEVELKETNNKISEFKKTSKEQEAELQNRLNEQNKAIIDNLNAIKAERERVETDRNVALAKDKKGYTDAQDRQYKETIKSIEKAEKKFTAKLKVKEKELTALQESNQNTLNSYLAESASLKQEIKTLNKEVESIKRKELKRVGIKEKLNKDDIEISVPDEK